MRPNRYPRVRGRENTTPLAWTPHNPSKRALQMVLNPLPAPTTCRYCSAPVEIVGNEQIYGKPYGRWPWAYRCTACHAYVGMHPFTNIPLGTLADQRLRKARNESKQPFEVLWRTNLLSRDQAYSELATHLGIAVEQCHFGWFELDQCSRARLWAQGRMAYAPGSTPRPKTNLGAQPGAL